MKKTTKAHLAVLSTNLFFGANYSFVKMISPALGGPFALNVLRVGCSLILFWLLQPFGQTPAGIKKEHVGRFLLCGLCGIAINQTLFVKGVSLTSTTHASLLSLTTPLLISVFALLVLKEPLTRFKIFGLILGVTGSVVLVLQKESSAHAPNYLLGDAFILTNALAYTAYFILVKPLMQTYPPLHVVRWVFTFGLLMILPFSFGELARIQWNAFAPVHFMALTVVVLGGTFLAYFFNAFALQHLGAGTTGSYIYTQPVFAVLIASVFLAETLNWQKGAAALLIFSGVYLVSFKRKK